MGKLTRKELLRRRRERRKEKERLKALEEQGFETFFQNDSYTRAHPEEKEGHYPGNQRNTFVIQLKKQQILHT